MYNKMYEQTVVVKSLMQVEETITILTETPLTIQEIKDKLKQSANVGDFIDSLDENEFVQDIYDDDGQDLYTLSMSMSNVNTKEVDIEVLE